MKTIFLIAGIFVAGSLSAQQIATGLTNSKNVFIGFYQYTPPEYITEPSRKFPLIIFLHGLGERGNGTTELSRVTTHGVPKHIKNGHPMRFFWNGKWESFIVLSPQLSTSYSVWQTFYVDEMIKYAEENLRIDPDRIAITGMSLGGGGTWSFAARTVNNPKKLSSIATVCGTYKLADMSGIVNANLPVWAFHATDDGSVSVNNTINAISRINALNPAVKPYMTIWSTGNHGIWDRAYDVGYAAANPNLYEWMLAQNKSLPVNVRPHADSGPDLTITAGTPVNLTGALSKDPDGKLVRFIWTKIAGPATGTLSNPVSEDGVTTINGLGPGVHLYQLKAVDDRADYGLDTVRINVVGMATPNIPPVIKTNDEEISFLTRAPLDGTASYDPDGVIVSYEWTYLEGPPQFTILNENAPMAEVINLSNGVYKFQLEAIDNKGAVSTGIVVINEISSILNVEFEKISATTTAEGNLIEWWAHSEYQHNSFEVQKSIDGKEFYTVGIVKGKESSEPIRQYSYTDKEFTNSKTFYRVVHTAINNHQVISKIVSAEAAQVTGNLHLYPVPAGNTLHINLKDWQKGKTNISVIDMHGKVLSAFSNELSSNSQQLPVNVKGLLPGMYFIRIQHENGNALLKKFVKR